MQKRRSWAVDYAVYLLVRAVIAVVQMLSWPRAIALASWLAGVLHRLDRRHREVAAENLRHAFPEMDEAGVDAMVRATYLHWAKVAVETIRLPRTLYARNIDDHFAYADPADYGRALDFSKRAGPRIFLTGHFGNFEVMSYMLGLWGLREPVVARRLDNPYLDRLIRSFRQKTGQELLDKSLDYNRILATLAQGRCLGILADQDAGPRGQFVDFFGRPASTFKSVALLSLEYGAPIIVMGAGRVGDPMRYRLYVEDVIHPEEHARQRDPVRAITQRYTQALERMARRHPEQYFWLHRRWKSQPKSKAASRAA